MAASPPGTWLPPGAERIGAKRLNSTDLFTIGFPASTIGSLRIDSPASVSPLAGRMLRERGFTPVMDTGTEATLSNLLPKGSPFVMVGERSITYDSARTWRRRGACVGVIGLWVGTIAIGALLITRGIVEPTIPVYCIVGGAFAAIIGIALIGYGMRFRSEVVRIRLDVTPGSGAITATVSAGRVFSANWKGSWGSGRSPDRIEPEMGLDDLVKSLSADLEKGLEPGLPLPG